MIKKIFIVFICFILSINSVAFADDEIEEVEEEFTIETSSENTLVEPETYSKHIICIERTTNQVLYEKDAYTQCAMASTTKIMTAIVILENCDLSAEVEISSKAANTGGSTLGITAGSKITVESLLYGLLLRSGNDAAVALAEYVAGSVDSFAEMMNEKAVELGLVNTHFVTPHGLDDDNHYTTAYDLAILTNYALENKKFKEIVGTKTITIMIGNYSRTLNNTNELLGYVDGVYGVKTGFTGNAGRCLVTACKRNNLDVIIVVLGADTKKIRGSDTKKVIDYVFENFEMVDTYEIIKTAFENFKETQNINVTKSLSTPKINFIDNFTYVYPINKNEVQNLKTSIYTVILLDNETQKGTKIGTLKLNCNDEILYSVDIILANDLTRTTWKDYFKIFLKNYKYYF